MTLSAKPAQSDVITESVSNCAGGQWYVARTHARTEDQAICNLETQGYLVFCPRYRRTTRHARKTRNVLAPLFPTYVFVSFDISRDRWRSINGTRGVAHLLMRGGMPQLVPAGIVDDLRARMRADGSMDWIPTLSIGDAVRIAEGPFAALLGTLEYLDAAGRVRVLLNLLGRSVPVHLRCDEVVPANVV
jgi:transcription elongation factor/antiterminator RfaH